MDRDKFDIHRPDLSAAHRALLDWLCGADLPDLDEPPGCDTFEDVTDELALAFADSKLDPPDDSELDPPTDQEEDPVSYPLLGEPVHGPTKSWRDCSCGLPWYMLAAANAVACPRCLAPVGS